MARKTPAKKEGTVGTLDLLSKGIWPPVALFLMLFFGLFQLYFGLSQMEDRARETREKSQKEAEKNVPTTFTWFA
jgi:hypothetical protein